MKKSIVKNYIYNLSYQILVLIVPLITTPYISRILGAENIGIYSYTVSISAYFILFGSLGIALYGQREIAYQQKDKDKYSTTFWEIVILRVITLLVSMVVFYFAFACRGNYRIYYRILMIEILANCIDISWFFQGIEEFKKTVVRNMIVKIIGIICTFILIKTKEDLVKYYWIYVISLLLANISLWLYIPKYIKRIALKKLKLTRHLKPTISLFVPQVAMQVYTLLDKTMIGTIISDKSEVGFYDQSQKIIKVILTVITSLGTVMLPRIASTFADGESKKIERYMLKSFRMVALLAFPMMFGIMAVSKSFVPVFFGDGYEKVSILMIVISPIILLIGLSNITGTQFLIPMRRQREFTISVICGAMVNFITNLILINLCGAIGASIGTVIAECVVTLIQIYFVRRDFEFKEILKGMKDYLFSSLIMFVVCFILGVLIKDNVISMITQVIVGGLVYMSCLLILKDKFVFEVLNKIKVKIIGG